MCGRVMCECEMCECEMCGCVMCADMQRTAVELTHVSNFAPNLKIVRRIAIRSKPHVLYLNSNETQINTQSKD